MAGAGRCALALAGLRHDYTSSGGNGVPPALWLAESAWSRLEYAGTSARRPRGYWGLPSTGTRNITQVDNYLYKQAILLALKIPIQRTFCRNIY